MNRSEDEPPHSSSVSEHRRPVSLQQNSVRTDDDGVDESRSDSVPHRNAPISGDAVSPPTTLLVRYADRGARRERALSAYIQLKNGSKPRWKRK